MAAPTHLNLAARILLAVQAGQPADQALRAQLRRTRHYSAPGERRAVSRAVFAYFRWWRWLEPRNSLQQQLVAATDWQDRFERNPALAKPEALAARAVPEWLRDAIAWPELSPVTDAGTAATAPSASPAPAVRRPTPTELAWLRQLQREPVLWIRPQQSRAAAVAAALGECTPASLGERFPVFAPPLAALAYAGRTDLFQTPAFQAGEFEIQDLASQLVGHACAPQPGACWWDACAGEGGKSLHLADLMENRGLLWVSDRSVRRMALLRERAARARVFNFRIAPWDGGARRPTRTVFDGVLVDAPCSGIGTWQRNPHARWTTQPEDVRELAAVQARLLAHAAPALKSGGRLVYAVCTLTQAETTAVADHFTATHPDFAPAPVFAPPAGTPPGPAAPLILWPHTLNANGMFLAAWRRR